VGKRATIDIVAGRPRSIARTISRATGSGAPIGGGVPAPHDHPELLCQPFIALGEGTPDTVVAQWHFDEDAEDDDDQGYEWTDGSADLSPYDPALGGHATTANGTTIVIFPWTAGVPFAVDLDMMVRSKFPGETDPEREMLVRFHASGGTTLGSFTLGPATIVGSYQHFSGSQTAPTGTITASLVVDARTRFDNVIVTIPGSGSAGAGGSPGAHSDLVGTGPKAARCDHRHHVLRDRPPTSDDDLTQGYPAGTFWLHVDDEEDPTQVFGRYVSVDHSTGAAVWIGDAAAPDHTHDDIETGAYTTTDGTDDVTYVADAGATHTIEDPTANVQDITLTEAVTLTFPTPTDGKGFLIRLHPDGNAVTWDSDVVWAGGTAPTLDGDLHILGFISDGTSWFGAEYGAGGVARRADDVRDAGRWEVVVDGNPAAAVTTEDGIDWVYGWVPG